MNMEIVSIEKKTFEMMVAAFGALSEKVAALRRKSDTGRMERWLTGEEVCGQLRISLRTLQKLRDRGFIGYSQIGFRFYYKPEDVKRLIPLIGTICPTHK
ncbi:UNVERIFIED_CONTAM: helix-turn-helix domain-containing protein [Bacteroidetes bacterium 56_B9]